MNLNCFGQSTTVRTALGGWNVPGTSLVVIVLTSSMFLNFFLSSFVGAIVKTSF